MKKGMCIVFALALSLNMILFAAACGDNNGADNGNEIVIDDNSNEIVIDFDQEETYLDQDGKNLGARTVIEKYLSIDITPNLEPVKKSRFTR